MYKKGLKYTVLILLLLLASFMLAQGWWHLWMYNGWFGTPEILHKILPGVIDELLSNLVFSQLNQAAA